MYQNRGTAKIGRLHFCNDFGQIYVPQMNLYPCVGVVLIVLVFRSSDALAAAYGIAAGTAVFLSPRADIVPGALLHNLKHNKVLHERLGLAHVTVENIPTVPAIESSKSTSLERDSSTSSSTTVSLKRRTRPARWKPPDRLALAIDVPNTTFFIGHETLVPSDPSILGKWRTWLYMHLGSAGVSPGQFYRLPANRVVEKGTQVTI